MKSDSEDELKDISKQEMRRTTIKSLAGFILGALGLLGGIKWLVAGTDAEGLSRPLRKVLETNRKVATIFFSNKNLAPVFPKEQAAPEPRLNGNIGLERSIDVENWMLNVQNNSLIHGINKSSMKLTLDDIKQLPKTELTFEFKCIEGWSEISNWGGTKFSDFMLVYGLGGLTDHGQDNLLAEHVSLETPDGGYYVGLDMESALHPQTLLCYEMNGKPLSSEHGAPLRLIVPCKYGIKSIKRIGKIAFVGNQPADYWAERGYDYYAGL
ncbi:MAG: molybdopterin-dependent oxidoreductase [Sporocytophaga sp.]|uniref:molybdopterin-dependent oxidoreductase n=1 Tax=Sporocytophaga sp. TaxID=2231183 RepID=UPI001B0E13BA|nr:molybdopterin-dependent oxidoreductase [Sporocytophaga sp.]MBO9699509.1 molybdopterin-dependent oxidoreductase [Sporocytophaga sp.]